MMLDESRARGKAKDELLRCVTADLLWCHAFYSPF